jgi:hypothetical protein
MTICPGESLAKERAASAFSGLRRRLDWARSRLSLDEGLVTRGRSAIYSCRRFRNSAFAQVNSERQRRSRGLIGMVPSAVIREQLVAIRHRLRGFEVGGSDPIL